MIFLLWRGSCSGRGFSFYQHIVDGVRINTKYRFEIAPAISFLLPKTNSIEKRGGGA
nr:MAG TPA: envelope glycoprotein [Bacteriophage sp.]